MLHAFFAVLFDGANRIEIYCPKAGNYEPAITAHQTTVLFYRLQHDSFHALFEFEDAVFSQSQSLAHCLGHHDTSGLVDDYLHIPYGTT